MNRIHTIIIIVVGTACLLPSFVFAAPAAPDLLAIDELVTALEHRIVHSFASDIAEDARALLAELDVHQVDEPGKPELDNDCDDVTPPLVDNGRIFDDGVGWACSLAAWRAIDDDDDDSLTDTHHEEEASAGDSAAVGGRPAWDDMEPTLVDLQAPWWPVRAHARRTLLRHS